MRKIGLFLISVLILACLSMGDLRKENIVFKEDFEGIERIPENWTQYLQIQIKLKSLLTPAQAIRAERVF